MADGDVFFYRICGLSVASALALPGANDVVPQAAPDVTIRQGAVPENLPDAHASGPTWQIATDQLLLAIPNVARFLLAGGNSIIFAPAGDASPEDLTIFLIGTVFGMLLHQRGQIVLHASAVNVNGRAMLFCGPSGAGKSTLAAALGQHGYPIVTDDVCALTLAGASAPIVHPDGRQLKLWQQAIDRLALSPGPQIRGSLQKFYIDTFKAHSAPLPLGAVYCLRETIVPLEPGIATPNVVEAAQLLRRNAYRPLLVRRMNQKEQYLRALTAIADHAGIYYLTRALDFSKLPETISWLEAHWRMLTERAA